MRRQILSIFALCCCLSGPALGCPVSELYEIVHSPLDGLKDLTIDATSDIQTSEGAEWHVYREKDGRVHTIILEAFGESGRSTYRLTVRNRTEYVISSKRIDYNAHAFLGGPVVPVKETTEFFYFCKGEPFIPKSEMTFVGDEYVRSAKEVRKLIFEAKSVKFYTQGLK